MSKEKQGVRADVVVCGTLVADVRVRPFVPIGPDEPGSLRIVEEVRLAAGGVVSNTGLALTRLGLQVGAVGRLGDDAIGQVIYAALADGGLKVEGVRHQASVPTETVVVCIAPDGERTFQLAQGANRLVDVTDLDAMWPELVQARAIVLGYLGELPLLDPHLPEVLSRLRRETEALLVLETAGPQRHTRELLDACLPYLDVFFPSWQEARDLTDASTPEAALASLSHIRGPSIVGVKLGDRGCLLCDGHSTLAIPANPIKMVDATGAGDTFLAGLVAALLDGHGPQTACAIGNLAAALSISSVNGATGLPPLAHLVERARSQA